MHSNKKTVLVVDDEQMIQTLLKDVLSGQDFNVITADNSDAALEKMKYHQVDLLLTDINLQGKDGLSLAEEVKKSRNIPIMIFSSQGTKEVVAQSKEIGIDSFYLKSRFNVPDFVKRVKAVLEKHPKNLTNTIVNSNIFKVDEASTPLNFQFKIENLKAMPFVVSSIIELSNNPYASLNELVKLVSTDAAIAAKLIKVANSAFYVKSKKSDNLKQAALNLGFKTVREITVSIGFIENFKVSKGVLNRLDLWANSLIVAVLAREIAKQTRLIDAEQAFITGLLAKIGQIFLDEYFPHLYDKVITEVFNSGGTLEAIEKDQLKTTHLEFGDKVLEQWKVPDAIRKAILYHKNSTAEIANLSDDYKKSSAIIAIATLLGDCMSQGSQGLEVIKIIDKELLDLVGFAHKSRIENILNGINFELHNLLANLLENTGIKKALLHIGEAKEKATIFIINSKIVSDPVLVRYKDTHHIIQGNLSRILNYDINFIVWYLTAAAEVDVFNQEILRMRDMHKILAKVIVIPIDASIPIQSIKVDPLVHIVTFPLLGSRLDAYFC